MRTPNAGDVRTVDLLVVRISFHHDRVRAGRIRPRHPGRRHAGRYALAVATGLLALLSIDTVPAVAATTGSNTATLALTPAPIRSVTVTPATATFGACSGPNSSELFFPNGVCTVGLGGTGGITGGVTITNGTAAGHIDVNGQNATPSDNGTAWSLVSVGTPGVDQFREATDGAAVNTVGTNLTIVSTQAACDTAFTVTSGAGDCTASAGQSADESVVVEGPSSSTDQNGPFTITTTWTAVP